VASGKRGPKTVLTDEELVVAIRAVLAVCPFHSEGHRQVHFRLRAQGIRVGRQRVLRLMGAHHLLVPSRPRHEHGDPAHAGTIITTRPDEMRGTDATRFYTAREGWCGFFGAVDHYTTEVMGWHVAKLGDRGAALEPIRQGMTTAFGSIAPKVALGVALRHDWGTQYTANIFVNEIKCWGFTDTPAFVGEPEGEPECNGCAERFMRTLKEQGLYLHQFRDLEEARAIIGAFIARYNAEWIVERLGYRTPAQARRDAFLQECEFRRSKAPSFQSRCNDEPV
jgi:putative transposase